MQSSHIFIYMFLQLTTRLALVCTQGLFPEGYNEQSVKLPIDINPVPSLKMSNAIAPVTHISLHSKQSDNLILSNHNFMSLAGKY